MPKGINNEISHSTYTIYHKSRRIEGLDTKAVSNCVYVEAHFNSMSFDRISFFSFQRYSSNAEKNGYEISMILNYPTQNYVIIIWIKLIRLGTQMEAMSVDA